MGRYFIENHRVSPQRISITGFSEYQPLAPNNSEFNMERNRRVEIHIRYLNERGVTPSEIYKSVEGEGMTIEGMGRPMPETEN